MPAERSTATGAGDGVQGGDSPPGQTAVASGVAVEAGASTAATGLGVGVADGDCGGGGGGAAVGPGVIGSGEKVGTGGWSTE